MYYKVDHIDKGECIFVDACNLFTAYAYGLKFFECEYIIVTPARQHDVLWGLYSGTRMYLTLENVFPYDNDFGAPSKDDHAFYEIYRKYLEGK